MKSSTSPGRDTVNGARARERTPLRVTRNLRALVRGCCLQQRWAPNGRCEDAGLNCIALRISSSEFGAGSAFRDGKDHSCAQPRYV